MKLIVVFQREYNEKARFSTLFYFFRHPPEFHMEFMSSCLQLINVLVHSVDDSNYRVSLQYEFTLLGLDDYLSVSLHVLLTTLFIPLDIGTKRMRILDSSSAFVSRKFY